MLLASQRQTSATPPLNMASKKPVFILPSTRLLIWMHERNAIKLHIQVFLRMNTWMLDTCRRHYYWIKTL